METFFMNTKNSKTNEPNRFKYDLIDKLDLQNPNRNMALGNLSIYYTRKNVKSTYNNNKFKISAPTWNSLPNKIKKGAYVINLDEYENTDTHWVSLFVKPKYRVYFDSFGIEHIPKEVNKFINNDIKGNIFRVQAYDSIMCGYFCIEFIYYMLTGKTLLNYTNLFSRNDFKKNDVIIKRLFKNEEFEINRCK